MLLLANDVLFWFWEGGGGSEGGGPKIGNFPLGRDFLANFLSIWEGWGGQGDTVMTHLVRQLT